MEITKGTMAYKLLMVFGMCGKFPFHSLYLIPGSHEWMLKVLIRDALLPSNMRDDTYTLGIDGWDEKTRTGYYFFFDCDLVRLKGMKNFFPLDDPHKHLTIRAFGYPWQKEILRRYFPESVEIETFEIEEIEDVLEESE